MKLSPRWRKALLTVHVVTAVGWLGIDLVQLTLGIAGLAGADPAVVYPALGLVGTVLFVPASILVWLVGVASSVLTPWGLVKHRWVAVKLLLTTVMVVLVLFLLRPNMLAALDLGAALPDHERLDMVVAPAVSSALLVIATVLSTYKPWGRTRAGKRAATTRAARVAAGAGAAGGAGGTGGTGAREHRIDAIGQRVRAVLADVANVVGAEVTLRSRLPRGTVSGSCGGGVRVSR